MDAVYVAIRGSSTPLDMVRVEQVIRSLFLLKCTCKVYIVHDEIKHRMYCVNTLGIKCSI